MRPDPLDYFIMSLDRFFKELAGHKISIRDVYRQVQDVKTQLLDVKKTLDKIDKNTKPAVFAKTVQFYCMIGGRKVRVVEMFMKKDDVLDLSIGFEDKEGNAAKVDGVPAWALTDEKMGKLDIAADGMSAAFFPQAVGKCVLQVKADADLGEGVKEIIGEMEIEISALEAVKVNISGVIRVK